MTGNTISSGRIRCVLLASGAALEAAVVWLFVPGTGCGPLIAYAALFAVVVVLAAWYWSPAQRRSRKVIDHQLRSELRALDLSLDEETEPTNGVRR